jgi:DmsE family decaheme c-type cytochrome
MWMKNCVAGVLAGIALLFCANAGAAEPGSATPAYAARGEQTCIRCHDQSPVIDILKTQHAVKGDPRTPFSSHGCETCHGASPEHIASAAKVKGDQKPVMPAIVFNGEQQSPVDVRNGVCLTCHQGQARINWKQSEHYANDVGCSNCHTIHVQKDPVLSKATQTEKCFTCHAEQRAASFQYSHHPIREGKVVCSDCHTPHGSPAEAQLKEWSENSLCYNCHADKRGPFLFNHEPVRESCMNCHTPHGSNQPRLLVERLPYLCQNCHDQGHPANVFSGTQLPPMNKAAPGATTLPSDYSLVHSLQSCMTCHSQIHGSNSPGGNNLTR